MAHNGFKNYATWAVLTWLSNEEYSQKYWCGRARATIGLFFDSWDVARGTLAAELKEHFEQSMPDLGGTLWSDLLNSALSEVDWHGIAANLLEEWKPATEHASGP